MPSTTARSRAIAIRPARDQRKNRSGATAPSSTSRRRPWESEAPAPCGAYCRIARGPWRPACRPNDGRRASVANSTSRPPARSALLRARDPVSPRPTVFYSSVVHRSRLAAIGIDCPEASFAATRDFWNGALGRTAMPEAAGAFTTVGWIEGREVFVQSINGSARTHLDIETDDVEAEVERLEALGARRVRFEQTWWIMEDPSGQPFCVVPPQSPDFPESSTTWDA